MATTENSFEIYFEWWLMELQKKGLVKKFEREPESLVVLEPSIIYSNVHYVKKDSILVSHNLCGASTYTRDYDVLFHRSLLDKLIGYLVPDEKNCYSLKELNPREKGDTYYDFTYYYVQKISEVNSDWITVSFDVKPPASALRFSAKLGSSREFPYNQKLVLERYGIYVNKVIPVGSKECLFNKTFMPQRYLFTDSGKQERKINPKFHKEIITIDQWMDSLGLKPIL